MSEGGDLVLVGGSTAPPALVLGPAGLLWLTPDGETLTPNRHDLAGLARRAPPLLLHRPSLCRRLGIEPFPALDLLELWAFVRPARPLVPTIGGLADVVAIASGDYHGLALKNDGTLVAWGYNAGGQLGNGTTDFSYAPTQVLGLSDVRSVAAGDHSSFALLADGRGFVKGNAPTASFRREFTVPTARLDALARDMVSGGFLALDSTYIPGDSLCGQPATDFPASILTLWQGGTRHEVRYYHGCYPQEEDAPPPIRSYLRWALAADSLGRTFEWVDSLRGR